MDEIKTFQGMYTCEGELREEHPWAIDIVAKGYDPHTGTTLFEWRGWHKVDDQAIDDMMGAS